MELKEYLCSKDISVQEFADMLNVSPVTLYNCINKERRIQRSTAKRIEELTGGAVSAISLRKRNEN